MFWNPVKASDVLRNRQSIWSFHLIGCISLRLASGDLYEQFNPPKAKVGTAEVRVLFTGNSRCVALRNRKTFSRWTPWRSDTQACHGQQTMESSWGKSAGQIPARWKLHRTYRSQFIPQHQQCVQQTTSPCINSINSSKAIDINYRDAVFNFKEENIDIDLNTRCIDWAELVGPKRLKKNPNFYRCESCQLTFESSWKSV